QGRCPGQPGSSLDRTALRSAAAWWPAWRRTHAAPGSERGPSPATGCDGEWSVGSFRRVYKQKRRPDGRRFHFSCDVLLRRRSRLLLARLLRDVLAGRLVDRPHAEANLAAIVDAQDLDLYLV